MSKAALGSAMTLLGLGDMPVDLVKSETVNRAYKSRVIECHPDTGTKRDASMAQLQSARALLLEYLERQAATCKVCHGSGKVRGRMGAQDCPGCSGVGDTGA